MKHPAPAIVPILALLTLLPGCGSEPSDRTAGGVTPGEAQALDDAAEMIDARRLPAEALRAPVQASAAPSTAAAEEPPR